MRGLSGLYGRGADAAAEILRRAYGIEVRKARNPLDDGDFVAIVSRVSNALKTAAGPEEAAAAARAAERLDRNWERLSDDERAAAIKAATDELRKAPGKFMPAVDVVIKASVEEVVPETRRQMIALHRLRIQADTTARDERTIKTVREVESFFVRDRYGQLADDLSARAREVVARGLEDGLGSKQISEDLQGVMAKAERPDSYWDLIATTLSNRARTFTQVHAFDDAGIKDFRVSAVMDQVTSNICRYLNGRVFHVAAASKRIDSVKGSDPEAILSLMPWVQDGRLENGKRAMYYKDAGGGKHVVATILESAVGRLDEAGTFGRGMQEGALERAGIVCPPYHGKCRTVLVPA